MTWYKTLGFTELLLIVLFLVAYFFYARKSVALAKKLAKGSKDFPEQAEMTVFPGALAVEEERLRMERSRQKLSEELRQAQKMEAIGTLAGGIAHDFNNVLAGIMGHADLLRAEAPPGSPTAATAEVSCTP